MVLELLEVAMTMFSRPRMNFFEVSLIGLGQWWYKPISTKVCYDGFISPLSEENYCLIYLKGLTQIWSLSSYHIQAAGHGKKSIPGGAELRNNVACLLGHMKPRFLHQRYLVGSRIVSVIETTSYQGRCNVVTLHRGWYVFGKMLCFLQ